MNRRNFLGSILGTVMTYPFFARLSTEPRQILPIPEIPDFSLFVRELRSGLLIQVPGIKTIENMIDGIQLTANPLLVNQVLTIGNGILFDNRSKKILQEKPFHSAVCMNPGDTLKMAYTITHNAGKVLTLDEAIAKGAFQ